MHLRNLITVTLIAVLFTAGTGLPVAAQQPRSYQVSLVWFAHVGTDAPSVDIYFGDTATTPIVSDLSFGDVTPMFAVLANKRGFVMREAGSAPDSVPIFTANWALTPNQSYLILATGLVYKRSFVLQPITLVRNNMQGKSRLRIINVISDSPPLRMLDTTGASLGTNLYYLRTVDLNHALGSSDLILQNRLGEVITTETVDFKADMLYVALITGDAIDTFPIDLQVLEIPQETTRVRVVNHADANLNVLLKRNAKQVPFATNLAPDAQTDFTDVPSGAASFLVKSAAEGADNRELAAALTQLRPSRDVTLTIQKSGAKLEIGVTAEELTNDLTIVGVEDGID